MNGQALVALHDEQAWREALDAVWNRELRPRLMEAILSLPPARPLRMSYEEFLEWADEDTLVEWVDGGGGAPLPAPAGQTTAPHLPQDEPGCGRGHCHRLQMVPR